MKINAGRTMYDELPTVHTVIFHKKLTVFILKALLIVAKWEHWMIICGIIEDRVNVFKNDNNGR